MSRDFARLAQQVITQSADARPRLLAIRQQVRAERKDSQELIAELKRQAERHTEIQRYARQIPGFFPTPRELAARMVELADIKWGMSALEPSAGAGHIADELRQAGTALTVIEYAPALCELLRKHGYDDVKCEDFLQSYRSPFSRIVMNPPFERGQDIDHVRHAFELLAPGGKLVAIMSAGTFFRSDQKATGFREWLDSVGGDAEKLPPDTFLKSDAPTGVQTYLVQIDGPGETPGPCISDAGSERWRSVRRVCMSRLTFTM